MKKISVFRDPVFREASARVWRSPLKTENRKQKTLPAFSLIELLVVMAIMVLLLALVAPAVNGVMESGRLTQAATILSNQFSIGHLKAMSENRPITLRFIRKDTASSFDRIQLLTIDNQGNMVAVDRVQTLPVGTAIAKSATLSSLLGSNPNPEQAATSSDPSVPGLGTSYRYIQFSFRPRGSLDLDMTQKWFATVVYLRNDTSSGIPANSITLLLDPLNGNFVTYQP